MKGRGAVMSIRFHGLSGSPFSWKFLLAPEHKALTYDIQVLKADAGDLMRPEYLAIGQGDEDTEQCNVPGWRRLCRRTPVRTNDPQLDHRMTSSARSSSEEGIVTPIAFAVFMLMANSILVGRSTGMSAGLAPLRMRST